MRRTSPILLALLGMVAAAEEGGTEAGSDSGGERTPLKTAVPQYPDSAFRERLEGEVQVCFHIDRGGRPFRVAVRASTHRVFEGPSIDAVRSSTWVPLEPEQELTWDKTCRRFFFRLTPVQDS